MNRLPEQEIKDNNSFLYVGNLETRKGSDILLSAYKRYRELGGMKALRFGGKIRETEIERLYEKMSKEVEGLHYLGYLENEARNKEYAECNSFLFPSRAEGFGMPVIEVMSYDKPILVADLNIYHEIVGDAIQYVELKGDLNKKIDQFAQAMLEMDDNVDKAAYRGILEKYSGKTIVSNLLKVIEE